MMRLSLALIIVSVSLLGQDAALEHARQWLPVAADFNWRMGNGELYRTTVKYKNHRHFEAATNLKFK